MPVSVKSPGEHDLINIPELLALICRDLPRADCVRVLYSSRLFFQLAVSYVWRELRGIHNLINLIPGVEVAEVGWKSKSIVSYPCNSGLRNLPYLVCRPYRKSQDLTSLGITCTPRLFDHLN
jgi:hypothetical protein